MATQPFEDYLAHLGINASGLKELLKSPKHYLASLEHRRPTTPAQRLGQLVHMAVLEPSRFATHVCVGRVYGRSKADQEAKALFWSAKPAQVEMVTQDEHDHICQVRDGVMRNSVARKLFARGYAEQSIFWRDEMWQIDCKARADFISRPKDDSPGLLVDLKTCKDASAVGFSRAVTQYRYDLQMAHYLAAGAVTKAFEPDECYLVAVETQKPYACVVYAMSEAMLGVGVQWRDEAMSRYKQAMESNTWPGYPEMGELGVNRWAKVPGEEEEGLL